MTEEQAERLIAAAHSIHMDIFSACLAVAAYVLLGELLRWMQFLAAWLKRGNS